MAEENLPPSDTQQRIDIGAVANEGLLHCRQGNWQAGLSHLAWVADRGVEDLDVAGLVYSYLGYGIAQTQARYREGLELCKKSVKVQFYEPDNYFNLARVYAMRGYRIQAFSAINQGLRLNNAHKGLLQLRKHLDRRRPPVLSFLPGKHPVNKTLGQIRHKLIQGLERLGEFLDLLLARGIRSYQRWDARATWSAITGGVGRLWGLVTRKGKSQ